MGVIEEINQMKGAGYDDSQIAGALAERGYSPRQINDALNQFQIKSAVASEDANFYEDMPVPEQETYTPETQDTQAQDYNQQYYQYPQQQEGYAYQTTTNADTIIEVSEQVFLEKSKSIQNRITKLEEFRVLAEAKIMNIDERLKKIETMIDRFQISILEKVGNYGGSLDNIKKEMSMIEDSFGKFVKGKTATIKHPKKEK